MSSPTEVSRLVGDAALILEQAGESDKINRNLLSWIEAIHQHGFAKARDLHPLSAGRFSDWMVTNAINVIAADSDQWPTRRQKVEAIAQILSGRMSKAQVRIIASGATQP